MRSGDVAGDIFQTTVDSVCRLHREATGRGDCSVADVHVRPNTGVAPTVDDTEQRLPATPSFEKDWPMARLYAQGDILIERVGATEVSGHVIEIVTDGSAVVSAGEKTGNHHRVVGSVILYRDDELARDLPTRLYVGHLQVKSASARLEHEEHAPIPLAQGTYRIRRQRQLEPTETGFLEQYGVLED